MTEAIHGFGPERAPVPFLSKCFQAPDCYILVSVVLLFLIGLLLGMAASPVIADRVGAGAFNYVFKQVMFGAVAAILMIVISALPIKIVRRLGIAVFAASLLGIFLLPIFGTDFDKGAVRWFSLGFGSVQPSEFLKPGFVVVSAWLMAGSLQPDGPPGALLSGALATLVAFLLVMQPDFGQATLILFAWVVMLFASGASIALLFGIAGMLFLAGFAAYHGSEHFAGRIDAFIQSGTLPYSQLEYSISAIKTGGLFGVGVGEGTIKYLLPDAHTDFILAVGAEEYGLILVLLIVLLFAFIVIRSLLILAREQDAFRRLTGTGLAMLFGIQAFINIGVSIKMLPPKGLTLPLISYGGSSVISMGILIGILLAVTRNDQRELPDDVTDFRPG